MYKKTKMLSVLVTTMTLGACGSDPGGFTAELQPVNVAGHDVRTVMAVGWMHTCFGHPDQAAIMLTQFEHVPGKRALKHLESGVVITEGNCNALLKALGHAGSGAMVPAAKVTNKSSSVALAGAGVAIT